MNKAQAKESIKLIDEVLDKHGISGPNDLKKLKETLVSEQTANEQMTLLMRARKIGLDLVALFWNKLSKRMKKPFEVTGKVDVDFPKKQEIAGAVTIDNIKGLEKQLLASIAELIKIRSTISKKENIKVSNFPKLQKVKVEGLDKLKSKDVQTVKLDKEIKIPDTVSLKEINKITDENKKTRDLLEEIIKDGIKTYLAGRDDPKNPLAVRLSDGKKFYNAIKRIEGIIRNTTSDNSGSSNIEPIRKNVEGGGKVTVGTTAVEVTFTGTTRAIIITADTDNTGLLYVGKNDVDSSGNNAVTFLEAGDSVEIDYNDVDNGLYVISDTASQSFWKGALL